jgi:hypothetical protein
MDPSKIEGMIERLSAALAEVELYLGEVTLPNPQARGLVVTLSPPNGEIQKSVRIVGWLSRFRPGYVYTVPVDPSHDWEVFRERDVSKEELEDFILEAKQLLD